MRWTKAAVLALGMTMLFGAVALAGDDFTGPYFGGTLAYVSPTGDVNVNGVKSELANGWGAALLGGYRFNKLMQLDGEVLYSDHNFKFADEVNDLSGDDDTSVIQYLAELNFHFLYYCGVQVYAGPVIGLATFDAVDLGTANFEIDNEFVYGANLGIDVPFSGRDDEKGWNFTARVKYLIMEPKTTNTGDCEFCGGVGDGSDPGSSGSSTDVREYDLKIDPWVLQAGVLYKW
jgi:hypothetical protein